MSERAFIVDEDTGSGILCYDVSGSSAVCFLSRAPEKPTPCEDRALVQSIGSRGVLIAVADGCGGMPCGADAAERAVAALSRSVADSDAGRAESVWAGVVAGFDRANDDVLAMGVGAGTTLMAALIFDDVARVVHAGDSSAVIMGQRGRIRFESVAHSPTAYAVEAGLMTESEAVVHEDRSIVLNVVGSADMRVDIGPSVRLNGRDTVLLASDGLTDNMLTHEVVEYVRAGPLDERVERLAQETRSIMTSQSPDVHGHPDDLTIVAFRPGRLTSRST